MSADVYFAISKLVGLALRAETWLLLCLALSVFAGLRRRTGGATFWSGLAFAMILSISALPVGDWVTAPLEKHFPWNPDLPPAPDGIIVLGGAVEARNWAVTGQIHFNEAGERLTETLGLATRFPEAKIVASGGYPYVGPPDTEYPTEAAAMAAFLSLHGIDTSRVTMEDQSRSTAENAEMTLALVQPAEGETWILVTSAWHIRRAMAVFEAAGWPPLIAWPADFTHPPGEIGGLRWEFPESLFYLNRAVKEHVGYWGYRFTGRI